MKLLDQCFTLRVKRLFIGSCVLLQTSPILINIVFIALMTAISASTIAANNSVTLINLMASMNAETSSMFMPELKAHSLNVTSLKRPSSPPVRLAAHTDQLNKKSEKIYDKKLVQRKPSNQHHMVSATLKHVDEQKKQQQPDGNMSATEEARKSDNVSAHIAPTSLFKPASSELMTNDETSRLRQHKQVNALRYHEKSHTPLSSSVAASSKELDQVELNALKHKLHECESECLNMMSESASLSSQSDVNKLQNRLQTKKEQCLNLKAQIKLREKHSVLPCFASTEPKTSVISKSFTPAKSSSTALKAPKFSILQMSEFSAFGSKPKKTEPEQPAVSAPDLPKAPIPRKPNVPIPKIPKIKIPKIPSFPTPGAKNPVIISIPQSDVPSASQSDSSAGSPLGTSAASPLGTSAASPSDASTASPPGTPTTLPPATSAAPPPVAPAVPPPDSPVVPLPVAPAAPPPGSSAVPPPPGSPAAPSLPGSPAVPPPPGSPAVSPPPGSPAVPPPPGSPAVPPPPLGSPAVPLPGAPSASPPGSLSVSLPDALDALPSDASTVPLPGAPTVPPPGAPAVPPPGTPAVPPPGTPAVPPPGAPAVPPPGAPAVSPPGAPAVSPPGAPAVSPPGAQAAPLPNTPTAPPPGAPVAPLSNVPGTPSSDNPVEPSQVPKPGSSNVPSSDASTDSVKDESTVPTLPTSAPLAVQVMGPDGSLKVVPIPSSSPAPTTAAPITPMGGSENAMSYGSQNLPRQEMSTQGAVPKGEPLPMMSSSSSSDMEPIGDPGELKAAPTMGMMGAGNMGSNQPNGLNMIPGLSEMPELSAKLGQPVFNAAGPVVMTPNGLTMLHGGMRQSTSSSASMGKEATMMKSPLASSADAVAHSNSEAHMSKQLF